MIPLHQRDTRKAVNPIYYKLRLPVITKCVDQQLLQNTATPYHNMRNLILLQIIAQRYYEMCKLLQIAATVITKCLSYYNMPRVLQNAAEH